MSDEYFIRDCEIIEHLFKLNSDFLLKSLESMLEGRLESADENDVQALNVFDQVKADLKKFGP